MDVASQLRELRARAGNPSYRTLEHLIGRQRRPQKMARSTIQEKLAGKSSLNLPQILAVVDALAEYAQANDVPLPKHETDREVWQDRVVDSLKTLRSDARVGSEDQNREISRNLEWDIEPLRQAQMEDLIDLVHDCRSKPVADWLPQVLRAMMQAEMTVTEFLKKAAEDSPQGVVNTVRALDREFPYEGGVVGWGGSSRSDANRETVGWLVNFSAMRHGESSAAAIVVGFRRSNVAVYVEEFLSRIATWFRSPGIENAVDKLRAAALGKDADFVLSSVARRQSNRVLEVVVHLQKTERIADASKVLSAIGSRGVYQIRGVVKNFEDRGASEAMLLEIAQGVSYEKYDEYIEKFKEWGHEEFVALLRRASEEPPF
ncbi:hypothetical protein [Streptomyces sp. NPDC058665]|uniref:hypothetical protein n=1 Tax=Streptomyces sp. NPDC058665 TaxID=3346586 RepID=UPI003661874C